MPDLLKKGFMLPYSIFPKSNPSNEMGQVFKTLLQFSLN